MSREIKFRAWNGKVMFYPNYIDNLGYAHGNVGNVRHVTSDVMQFTGLHDRNGREIYEGDVLKNYWENLPVRVEWDEHAGGWAPFMRDDTGGAEAVPGVCIVIGNIHENPDLLDSPAGFAPVEWVSRQEMERLFPRSPELLDSPLDAKEKESP